MAAAGPTGPETAPLGSAGGGETAWLAPEPLRPATRLPGGAAQEGRGWRGPTGAAPGQEAQSAPRRFGPGSHLFDLLVIALFAAVLRVPTFFLSVIGSADESAFVIAGREVLLGHLPYLTFWDHKPLGSTMLVASAMAALGQSMEAVRALGLVCVVATAWLLRLIARRLSPDRLVPLAAALLYVAFSTRLAGGIATITEVLLSPFTAAGVLLLLTAPGRRRAPGSASTFATAGLAFGIAVWIKYVPAIPAALTGSVALLAVMLRPGGGLALALACGGAFSAGILLPTAASMAAYWWAGEFAEFWQANFGFMAAYAGDGFQEHPRGRVFYAVRCVTLVAIDIWPLALTAAAAFLPSCLRPFLEPGRAYRSAVLVAWLAGEALAVAMQMKFYMYHFLPLLPPLCVLSAVAIRAHTGRIALPQKAAAAMALVVAFTAFGPVATHARAVAAALSRPDVPREIARLIRPELQRGDLAFVANYEPIIYFLADAPLPTRFAFPVLLTGPHMSVSPVEPHAEVRRILDNRPKFIVFNASWRDAPVPWDPEMMEWTERVTASDYVPRATWTLPESMGTVRLFARRD